MNWAKLALAATLALAPLSANAKVCGEASWYGPGLYGGRTANGESFSHDTMTAAHPYLPLGTRVRVTNRDNGRSIVVRINDRGPYYGGRIIDIAHGAAVPLGLTRSGVANVCIAKL